MPDTAISEQKIEDVTIRDLFAHSADSPVELGAGLDAENFQDIKKKISSLAEPIPWSRVQSEVGGEISRVLNTRLFDAWACAWEKYQDVKEDVEESLRSPDSVVLSPVAEHSIDSTLRPYVDVFLGPKRIERIDFDVTLTTQIKGLILGLKNGCITSLQLAECEWTGSVAAKGVTLVKRKLTKLDLPGRITLKRGIPLAPQAEAEAHPS